MKLGTNSQNVAKSGRVSRNNGATLVANLVLLPFWTKTKRMGYSVPIPGFGFTALPVSATNARVLA